MYNKNLVTVTVKLSLDSVNSYEGKIRIDSVRPNGRQLVLTYWL